MLQALQWVLFSCIAYLNVTDACNGGRNSPPMKDCRRVCLNMGYLIGSYNPSRNKCDCELRRGGQRNAHGQLRIYHPTKAPCGRNVVPIPGPGEPFQYLPPVAPPPPPPRCPRPCCQSACLQFPPAGPCPPQPACPPPPPPPCGAPPPCLSQGPAPPSYCPQPPPCLPQPNPANCPPPPVPPSPLPCPAQPLPPVPCPALGACPPPPVMPPCYG